MSRGPEATLQRGSTMEMLLDRELRFQDDELPPGASAPRHNFGPARQQELPPSKSTGWPPPTRPPSSN
jgi:hypothetical protein